MFLDAATAHDTEFNRNFNRTSESTCDAGNVDPVPINAVVFNNEFVIIIIINNTLKIFR